MYYIPFEPKNRQQAKVLLKELEIIGHSLRIIEVEFLNKFLDPNIDIPYEDLYGLYKSKYDIAFKEVQKKLKYIILNEKYFYETHKSQEKEYCSTFVESCLQQVRKNFKYDYSDN